MVVRSYIFFYLQVHELLYSGHNDLLDGFLELHDGFDVQAFVLAVDGAAQHELEQTACRKRERDVLLGMVRVHVHVHVHVQLRTTEDSSLLVVVVVVV